MSKDGMYRAGTRDVGILLDRCPGLKTSTFKATENGWSATLLLKGKRIPVRGFISPLGWAYHLTCRDNYVGYLDGLEDVADVLAEELKALS